MRHLFLLFLLPLPALLVGQAKKPPTSPFGYELSAGIIFPEITGNNTEAVTGFSYGTTLTGVVQFDLQETLTLETGLEIGYNTYRQTVTERNRAAEIIRIVEVDASFFHLGIPVFLKVSPATFGGYLKVGGRRVHNFTSATSARIVGPDPVPTGDAALFPPGKVNYPTYNTLLEVGVGYRFTGSSGRAAYLELNFAKPTRPVLENAGPRDAIGRINYLDTTKAYKLGITMGARFGR